MLTFKERTLHLIDIENLTGSSSPTAEEVRTCRDHYEWNFVGKHDLVVIACSHHAFPAVGWEWPRARYLLRSGEDGADLALLEVIACEGVVERFRSVVVASGDGIFTDAVARLGAAGVHVTAISRPKSMARTLRFAAGRHEFLPTTDVAVEFPLESA